MGTAPSDPAYVTARSRLRSNKGIPLMIEVASTHTGQRDHAGTHARSLHDEVAALSDLIPLAIARQWEPSPVPRPREDTSERSSGGDPTRPVEDVATDPRRLAVRAALFEARSAVAALRSATRSLSVAVARFDGE